MIKTVYGPPPVDAERIEAAEVEAESEIREDVGPLAELAVANQCNPRKRVGG